MVGVVIRDGICIIGGDFRIGYFMSVRVGLGDADGDYGRFGARCVQRDIV